MKPLGKNLRKRNAAALTLVEVLVTIFVIVILLGLFLPTLAPSTKRHRRITCAMNLKQIGLSFRISAADNGDKYPMAVSVTNGGTLELLTGGNVFPIFQVISNEIDDPRVLICPADTKRVAATNFTSFRNENISYFVGLDAREDSPNLLLLGDRNLTNGQPLQNQVLTITSNTPAGWTEKIHRNCGNIALADGSVQQISNPRLHQCINSALSALHQDGPNFHPPVTNGLLRLALP